MGTNLAVIDKELTARLPMFLQVLPPSVTPQRLMRTVMMSCERTPKLLECTPQSIVNAATTAAVLGLECDGVTGQGFLIPYGNVATFQVGYKGYNTLAARSGYTITGEVVREGDEFDYQLGSGAFVRHKPLPGPISGRRIVMAWAVAECHGRPNIVVVMSIEEIEQIKAKSPGARKKDSPWNDLNGPGYPAMCSKTAKRRLARSMPLSVMQQAVALEDQHEQGRAAFLAPDGNMRVVGEASAAPGPTGNGTISDRQPDEILTPANGSNDPFAGDERLPVIAFPACKTMNEFKTYSDEFLETATPPEAKAWELHFRDKLRTMGEHGRLDVREVAAELLETFGKITGAPDREAA